jgi:hypothetical protein
MKKLLFALGVVALALPLCSCKPAPAEKTAPAKKSS